MWWRGHNGVWVILATRVTFGLSWILFLRWAMWPTVLLFYIIINWNIFLFSIRRRTIFCLILTMVRSMEMMMMMQMKAQFTELTEWEESIFCKKKTERYARKLSNYFSKEGTSMFFQGRKLFSHFLVPILIKGKISLQDLKGNHGNYGG